MMEKLSKNNELLLQSIVTLIDSSRKRVASTINQELTLLYWNIGKEIKSNIVQNKRADYGKQLISDLARKLIEQYGRGFSKRNWFYCEFSGRLMYYVIIIAGGQRSEAGSRKKIASRIQYLNMHNPV